MFRSVAVLLSCSTHFSAAMRPTNAEHPTDDTGLDPELIEFLTSLRPCAACSKWTRYGEETDGGYPMCEEDLVENDSLGHISGILSFGIRGFDKWGMDLSAKFQKPVHQFDCYVRDVPEPLPGSHPFFHEQCIVPEGGFTNATMRTFSQILHDTGLNEASDNSILVKMDIEGAEVDIIANEPLSTFKKFRTFTVELHWMNKDNMERFFPFAKKLRDAGFVNAHMHGCNALNMVHFNGELQIPEVVELSFVQRAGCSPDGKLSFTDPEVDAPTWEWRPEIADAALPGAS